MYKKKNRGATLIAQKLGNTIEITCSYFDKWVAHSANLDKNETKITVGYHKHPGIYGKAVKWRSEWLKTRFIDCNEKIDNMTWYININPHSAMINTEEIIPGIHIGEDFRNINKAKFVAKVASKLNSLLKQEKENVVRQHYDNIVNDDYTRLSLEPGVLESCIKIVTEELPYLVIDKEQADYEYGINIFDISQGKEPELDDLPF